MPFLSSVWIARAMYGGWFRVYSFLLVIGFLVVIAVSFYCFYRRKIPVQPLYIGLFILVPCGVLGASFFGKLDYKHPIPFYELFAFWEPGLSIHGGMIIGTIGAWFWFSYCAPKYRISKWVYADLIFPNVLLGQAIGRWGNFFNHELLGAPVARSGLNWLPAFIKNSLFKWYIPANRGSNFLPSQATGLNGQGFNVDQFHQIQYYQPIFLYESFADVLLFLVIVFLVPFIVKQISMKQYQKNNTLVSKKSYWQDHYYQYTVKTDPSDHPQALLRSKYLQKAKKLTLKSKIKPWMVYKLNSYRLWFKASSKKLNQLNNPEKIIIKKCGVSGMAYWFGYNTIRFILETQRANQDLFIKNIRWLDYNIIIFLALLGALLMFIAQFIAPNKWRHHHWLYEKQY